MTHSYEFSSSLPYSRRKLNSAFLHQLKKLCGGKHGYHVFETLGDEELGDYAYVLLPYNEDGKAIATEVTALCLRYGIGSNYHHTYLTNEGKFRVEVYLERESPWL